MDLNSISVNKRAKKNLANNQPFEFKILSKCSKQTIQHRQEVARLFVNKGILLCYSFGIDRRIDRENCSQSENYIPDSMLVELHYNLMETQ